MSSCPFMPEFCAAEVHKNVEECVRALKEHCFAQNMYGDTVYVCPQCKSAYKDPFDVFLDNHLEHMGPLKASEKVAISLERPYYEEESTTPENIRQLDLRVCVMEQHMREFPKVNATEMVFYFLYKFQFIFNFLVSSSPDE